MTAVDPYAIRNAYRRHLDGLLAEKNDGGPAAPDNAVSRNPTPLRWGGTPDAVDSRIADLERQLRLTQAELAKQSARREQLRILRRMRGDQEDTEEEEDEGADAEASPEIDPEAFWNASDANARLRACRAVVGLESQPEVAAAACVRAQAPVPPHIARQCSKGFMASLRNRPAGIRSGKVKRRSAVKAARPKLSDLMNKAIAGGSPLRGWKLREATLAAHPDCERF